MKKPVKGQPAPNKPAPLSVKPVDNSRIIRYSAIICALFAFALYANTLSHDYTVDDGTVISNNKITKKGISAIPEIFSTSYRAGFWERQEGLYRPLSVAMFAIEWELAPENPSPGHWINVILYALTAFLMMMTLSNIFKNYSPLLPLLATLLFVVHPLHTEVVANIKSRDEILCVLFSILTFKYLLEWLQKKKWWTIMLAAVFLFLAFLSKENAITMLVIIPLFIWFFSDVPLKQNITTNLVFWGIAVIYFAIRISVLGEMTGSAEHQLINNSIIGAETFSDRLATAFAVLGKYIYLLFIPHPLSFDYSYNQIPVVSFGSAAALISTLILLFLAYKAFSGIRKKDPVSFGLLFFFGTISLVSNVLFLIESTLAERFIYMPSLGFAIVIAYLLLKSFKLLKPDAAIPMKSVFSKKPVFASIVVIVLLLYSVKTISRNSEWKDNLTLLAKDVKTCPNSARIRYAYGSALLIEKALKEENKDLKAGYLDKSIVELEKGVSILPNYAEAWNHLGIAYKEKNNASAAIAAFEKARSYKKFKEADFYISSGLAYGMGQKYDLAIADFNIALSIDPDNAEAYNNKGLYLSEGGKNDSSLVYFDKAISLKENFYQAYYNKGNALAKQGNYPGAIALYQQSLKAKPGYVDALLNMGNSYAAMNDYKNALDYFRQVEAADPNNAKVLYNIGITYRILGDEANAQIYMDKANKAGLGK